MNYHDSERLLSHLEEINFTSTDSRDDADLILFNTCSIRDLANSKFYSHLGELKKFKQRLGRELVIGVGGCIAQIEGEELIRRFAHLDFAFGTDVIDQINQLVLRAYLSEEKFSLNKWDRGRDYSIETKIVHGEPQAFVNIIKGCDKFCTYCIVPYTRGREKSRRLAEIVGDCTNLVKEQGVSEITLLGQNVNSFGKEHSETLAELIERLEPLVGLKRMRYTTSHPYDLSDALIAIHGRSKKLANNLHLPVQSGSDSVLSRMRREYTIEHYLDLVERLRAANPALSLSTDIIVGFPNESEEEFLATIELLNRVRFDSIYSFKFSPRKGTKAAKIDDLLTEEVRGQRLQQVQKRQLEIQAEDRQKMVGQRYEILVEGSKVMKGQFKWSGRTSCNRIIHFLPEQEGVDYQWQWIEVEVIEATALSCQGRVVRE
ncbi:MAG: tRNA (N6-isopentenyl adenosine(37)-C2)-methylthiotransferase MiaB [Bdellovibrionales bacterium]|nr:tRNA (N6-isopentenyl adenosine(37)-C2)-methylthiotransferase MiaB [Bdellovibrionales bacterium]MBT3526740.1 tRNA (N6-isopentenyl adenosine(37)-C2)-methylthiotransferase MiaB [Bdellovibrionales bacterium]